MAAAGFGCEPAAASGSAAARAGQAEASFSSRLDTQRREFERMLAVQTELRADEEKLSATLDKLRRKMDEASRALSAAEARRERLRRELARTEAECGEHARQKERCAAQIHEATAAAAAEREEKLRRACGGAPCAGAAPPVPRELAGMAAIEPNLLGDEPVEQAGAARASALDDDLLGLSLDAPPRLAAAAPSGTDLLGDLGGVGSAPGGGAIGREDFDGFGGFDCGPGGGRAADPQLDPFGLDVRSVPGGATDDAFWGSSPLTGMGGASKPAPYASPSACQGGSPAAQAGMARGAPSASADPFSDLSFLGAAMTRR
eukprot:scaffold195676_cov23-Tisochrysis_lutea.AAC.2